MYSINEIKEGLSGRLIKYLEADYHIWDKSLIKARRMLLERKGVISNEPFLEASPMYESSVEFSKMNIPRESMNLLSELSKIEGSGVFRTPRSHQKEALEHFLGHGEEIIVTTGTGSGKTESFLYPIIGSFALEKARGKESYEKTGCRVILLYPMNALVNDQLTRLRKMVGNKQVAEKLLEYRGKRVTFGVYTSKTDYPGKRSSTRDKNIKKKIEELYLNPDAEKQREMLWNEGLWPAKDLDRYIKGDYHTSENDAELFSRQEIQEHTPDILVTNYSMLEYMLMRPIERSIFEQTSDWLNSHPDNRLTIVIDEAHIYRGVGGAEVGLLLRRLQARLGVNRDKIQYVLTSASFSGEDAAVSFANKLTGKKDDPDSFKLITGKKLKKQHPNLPNKVQLNALAKFDTQTLYDINISPEERSKQVGLLLESLGLGSVEAPQDVVELKNYIYERLENFPPAAYLYNKLTDAPHQYNSLLDEFTGGVGIGARALDSLLALCTFAQERETKQVFMPIRLHLMYRGIPSLHVCVNPNCTEREKNIEGNILGSLYTHSDLVCKCGGRIYELMTHRDCGAAFIRGYVNKSDPNFLIHEQSFEDGQEKLTEVHYFIEPKRIRTAGTPIKYLHIKSGRLTDNPGLDMIEVGCPEGVESKNDHLRTFSKCPVCGDSLETKQGDLKIQDLRTKGEAPFSYLVREQVFNQPASKPQTKKSPLGGRKTLIFSDGRQKAARLARDIPRNLDRDLFRIALLLAIEYLHKKGKKNITLDKLYPAFLWVISKRGLVLFDGDDRAQLLKDLAMLEHWDEDELFDSGLHTPPNKFKELLLINLCNKFYSFSALTLAYVGPRAKRLMQFAEHTKNKYDLSDQDCLDISINWISKLLSSSRFPFDSKNIASQIRKNANYGYGSSENWGIKKGSSSGLKVGFLNKDQLKSLESDMVEFFCQASTDNERYFLNPGDLSIEIYMDGVWHQCEDCTKLCTHPIRGNCPHCGSDNLEKLNPNESEYLRARKSFYRDPCKAALDGSEKELFNLAVEEHTAQLSYRDERSYSATTEIFERRFKDILIKDEDTSIDILSCTTTMEVGVDIGSLIAVSMRNVPPERQNYQQRSGRAGRRGAAISTVVTFAQNGSHDSHYFDNPSQIIKGEPPEVTIDVENTKIIKRHVVAAIIQSFFHSFKIDVNNETNDLLSVLGGTDDFYNSDDRFSLKSLKAWLKNDFNNEGYARSIEKWIPSSKVKIDEVKEDLVAKLEASSSDTNPKSPNLLDHFFDMDLLPTYAFPRNICSFRIEKRGDHFGKIEMVENPQQGLATALTEYAPDRLVVVNKKTYRVGTVAANSTSTEINRAVALFKNKSQYLQCSNCNFTKDYIGESYQKGCPHCGEDSVHLLDLIQPEVVYPSGRGAMDEHEDDLFSYVTPAQLPFIGPSSGLESGKKYRGDHVDVAKRSDETLVSINQGTDETDKKGFWICNQCGKASASEETPTSPHERDYLIARGDLNSKCSGTFERVFLGYKFNSDLSLMRIALKPPISQNWAGIQVSAIRSAARTIAEALVQSLARHLDVNPNEMNCGVRFLNISGIYHVDIYIYDTASGGAGYSVEIANRTEPLMRDAFDRQLNKKDCCESSCYKCLQNYGNRFVHSQLDKRFGRMLWEYIYYQKAPDQYDPKQQKDMASPLIELMALDGYTFKGTDNEGLLFDFNSRKLKVVIHPFLIDVSGLPSDAIYITDYEVLKSIPSAFSKIDHYANG